MKQGRASVKGPADQKVNPTSRAISPGAVSQIGISLGNHSENRDLNTTYPNLNLGNGFDGNSTGTGTASRPKGSQGRY